MYDNIFLQNRIGGNGKVKKTDLTIMDTSLKSALCIILLVLIGLYAIKYISIVGTVLTMDLLFETTLGNDSLKLLVLCIAAVGAMIYYCFGKAKHSVAFQVDGNNGFLNIVFNDGKHEGLEYHLMLNEISNICLYKNNSFSFYCNNIEVDKNGKLSYMKGKINFIGGDSAAFVADLRDYLDRNVKYVNKKN